MKCTKCNQKEATVFYREVVNGKETRYALCDSCAAEAEKEKGAFLSDFTKGSFFGDPFGEDLLGSLFSPVLPSMRPRKTEREEKKCTLCGATFRQLAQSGKVGCPVCYSVFAEELAPTLTRLHGAAVHRGRAPGKFQKKRSKERQLEELDKSLKQAIAEEKYEEAAKIRDQIRDLRGN